MGVAAYNRGSALISRRIDAEARPTQFEIIDRLNALTKRVKAGRPFGPVEIVFERGAWWVQCPVKKAAGMAFCYPTLSEAVQDWRIQLIGWDNGAWLADPA